jgi:hypothetical protein
MLTWKIAVGPVFAGAGFVLLERQPLVGWVLIGAGVASLAFAVFEPRLRVVLPDLRDHFHMALLIATMVAVASDIEHLRASTSASRGAVAPTTEVAEVARLEHELAICKAAATSSKQAGAVASPTLLHPQR